MDKGVKNCADIVAALKPRKVFPTNRYDEYNPAVKALADALRERRLKTEVIPQKVQLPLKFDRKEVGKTVNSRVVELTPEIYRIKDELNRGGNKDWKGPEMGFEA